MTLRVIDGFDYLPGSPYGVLTAAGWSGGGTGLLTIDNNTAFGYGYSIGYTGAINVGDNRCLRHLRGRYTTKGTIGIRQYVQSTDLGDIGVGDSQSTSFGQWVLRYRSDTRVLELYNGNGTLLARTAGGSFFAEKWFYLEIQWEPSATGSFEVRINTVPVLYLPNVNLIAGNLLLGVTQRGYDFLYFNQNNNNGRYWRWDDLYFLDAAGSVNNTFLGNVRAKYMAPMADASPIQWDIGGTTPAASNWQSVLNIALNDTKYVSASIVGKQDLYTIDPNVNSPTVFGVEVNGFYRQNDATQRAVRNVIESNGIQAEGPDKFLDQNYTSRADIFELNPDTGLQFTGTEVNALKIGPKVVL